MLHLLGAAAAAWGGTLEAYALPLGTRLQLHTTSRDVRPGPCVRLDIRAHTPGMLALDVVADARRSSAGARLEALFLSTYEQDRCPTADNPLPRAEAAETNPSTAHVALSTCATGASRWHLYVRGPPASLVAFNVTARLSGASAACSDRWIEELGPVGSLWADTASVTLLGIGVGALLLAAAAACALKARRARYQRI